MDYRTVDNFQVGMLSSHRLMDVPLEVQRESKNIEVDELAVVENLSHEGNKVGYMATCSEESHSIETNGYATLSEAGRSPATTNCGKDSFTELSYDKVLVSNMVPQNIVSFKDVQIKENQRVHLKVQNLSKPTIAQLGYQGNYNHVQAMRPFEDDGVDYGSGHENAINSFEFHKGNKAFHRSISRSHSKQVPSKWDDAEKWLVSHSSADGHVKNKLKTVAVQSQVSTARYSRKGSSSHQMDCQMNVTKVELPNATVILSSHVAVDGSGLYQDEGETKKIDSKVSLVQTVTNPVAENSNYSLDHHPMEDIFSQGPDDLKKVNDTEAFLRNSLRNEKPFADPAIVLRKQDSFTSLHSPVSYIQTPLNVRSVSMRNTGTEMTPIASQEPSRTGTPIRARTPMIRSPISSQPSTPGRAAPASSPTDATENELSDKKEARNSKFSEKDLHPKSRQDIMVPGAQLGKANIAAWSSQEEEDQDASKSLKTIDFVEAKKNIWGFRAAAWEDAEQAKYMARYKSEAIKIQAWESHQKAKAESEMRRIEVKVERMKSHAHEKLFNKLASLQRRVEEKRASAEAKQVEQAAKTRQQADYIRRTGHIPISFFHRRFCF